MCCRRACRTGANSGGGEMCPVSKEFINSRQKQLICSTVTCDKLARVQGSNADESLSILWVTVLVRSLHIVEECRLLCCYAVWLL
jgi:hypothetical protein